METVDFITPNNVHLGKLYMKHKKRGYLKNEIASFY